MKFTKQFRSFPFRSFPSYLCRRSRLQKELMQLMKCDEKKQLSAFPASDNIMQWVATIAGPEGTPYEGLSYKLSIQFPTDYPYSAPRVTFTSKCFHPNVSDNGEICLDILKENWSALYDVRTILLSIQSLLNEPNNNSPLNITAANMWQDQTRFTDAVISFYKSEK
ncbi:hypothetical protein SARC_13275 [Sphaeroforma arctica JP610]|uniref:UBC core domain-containing protein n=1 Tax=Sphaeroforma arctica JP610 TaxID=667725 RepID=A0A0L0FBN6_9EUKA|nr:hypothetical protein SARC_13275 [Sphaeroforma arctica JP610]KNC74172.1 hypothetical protein SARC_13275 [Sphaeroforma arctica JP610]|eukprot:XP_014148074.1 hypothetical protein SARC_13275 [Sphaeroforma arctica JP610]